MMSRMASTRPLAVLAFALSMVSLWLAPSTATAQPQFVVTPVAEKKLAQLPAGPLYWWVENFPTLAQAHAAEGPTSLAAEAAGKVWLLTRTFLYPIQQIAEKTRITPRNPSHM
jgi:hypothetical protein